MTGARMAIAHAFERGSRGRRSSCDFVDRAPAWRLEERSSVAPEALLPQVVRSECLAPHRRDGCSLLINQ
jgi:hypothetical protein